MFPGIDPGTSGVKAVLADERREIAATGSAPPEASRPRSLWSEQSPEDWWRTTVRAVAAVRRANPAALAAAASCLQWVPALTGATDEAPLLDEAGATGDHRGGLVFLPYLSGERTPHNDVPSAGMRVAGSGPSDDRPVPEPRARLPELGRNAREREYMIRFRILDADPE